VRLGHDHWPLQRPGSLASEHMGLSTDYSNSGWHFRLGPGGRMMLLSFPEPDLPSLWILKQTYLYKGSPATDRHTRIVFYPDEVSRI